MRKIFLSFLTVICFSLFTHIANAKTENNANIEGENMIVRIAKIKVYPEFLDEYLVFVNENAKASLS